MHSIRHDVMHLFYCDLRLESVQPVLSKQLQDNADFYLCLSLYMRMVILFASSQISNLAKNITLS